jgi:hypothetical protein
LLIPVSLPHCYDPNPIFLLVDPDAGHDFSTKQPIRDPSLLTIIESIVGLCEAFAREQLGCLSDIEPPIPQDFRALRGIEFDFHIIIVYTIYQKSQGRSRFTALASSARDASNVR